MLKRKLIYLVALLFPVKGNAQILQVTSGQTAQALAQNISGAGVTVSNTVFTCSQNGASIFDGSTSNIGLGLGVLPATGTASIATGPNNGLQLGVRFFFFKKTDAKVLLAVVSATQIFCRCPLLSANLFLKFYKRINGV